MDDDVDTYNGNNCQVEVSNTIPDWEEFLQHHPDATIYHSPLWGDIMQRAYGNRPFYLTARRNGKVTGILQLVAQKSLLFGSHLASLPYFDASGILAHDENATCALIEQAGQLLDTQSVKWVELRHLQPMGDSLPTRSDKVTMMLDLPHNEQELWDRFKPKVRNQIRKAQRENMQILRANIASPPGQANTTSPLSQANTASPPDQASMTSPHDRGRMNLLPEFYAIYSRNMRDLGSPPHSRRFFRLILESFPQQAVLYLVRLNGTSMAQHNGTSIAAGFSLRDQNIFRVPWAASNWKYRTMNPNMLLYWSMLADSCKQSAAYFDFGRSTVDSGTHRFKKQWGAQEIPLFWQFLLPEGQTLPDLQPDSPKYRYFIACWKKLPIWAAQMLGPRIIAKLS